MEKPDAREVFNPIFSSSYESRGIVMTELEKVETAIKATQNILMDVHMMLMRITEAETLGQAQLAAEDALIEIKKIGFTL